MTRSSRLDCAILLLAPAAVAWLTAVSAAQGPWSAPESPAAAVRESRIAASPETPQGSWSLRVEWPEQPADVTLSVTDGGDEGLAATWQGPRGTVTARNVAFQDAVLTFLLPVHTTGSKPVELRFEGTITGDRIDGKLLAPNGTEINADGKRVDGATSPGRGDGT